MRVAVVVGEPGPAEGQAADRTLALAEALRGLGHHVSVCVRCSPTHLDEQLRAEACDGVQVVALPAVRMPDRDPEAVLRRTPAFGRALVQAWQSDPPDLVHACGLDAGLAALTALLRTGDPPLVVERVTDPPGGGPCPPEVARRIRLLQGVLAREADLLLAHTPAEAQLLRRLGAVRRRVAVLPLAVDTDRFAPRTRGASDPAPPHLLSLDGGRSPGAVPLLIAALERLPGVVATVVGGPPAASRGQVRRLPEVPHRRVSALLAAADVLVSVPGRTASGAVVLEAMACAVPVVAVETAAVRDLVVDGVTGVLVPPGQPALLARVLRQVLRDGSLREAMGIAGADRARARHAWPLVAGRLDALYPLVRAGA